jgi:hypothetical protein
LLIAASVYLLIAAETLRNMSPEQRFSCLHEPILFSIVV